MTWKMTWQQMNTLEELTYEMKALLEVVMDGLNNTDCPSNTEDSSAVLRQATEKLIKIRGIHEEAWEAHRQELFGNSKDEANEEFDSDDEESDFKIAGLFCEDDSDEQEPTSFKVDLAEEHEDGSATFTVSGSKESMKQLFEAFFTQALINGIKSTAADNDKETAKMHALKVAREFEFMIRLWEELDNFDYEPDVRRKREELEEALKAL